MTDKQSDAPKFSDLAQLTDNNGVKLDAVVSLLGALCDSNDDIVNYKKEQKEGDITFRRRINRHSKQSTWLNVVSIVIACVALAISLDVPVVGAISSFFTGGAL